jgi:hypothetical protein
METGFLQLFLFLPISFILLLLHIYLSLMVYILSHRHHTITHLKINILDKLTITGIDFN